MTFRSSVRLSTIAFVAFVASACTPISLLNAITPDSSYRLSADVPFGTHAQTADVYVPLDRKHQPIADAPVVLFIYGGSWQTTATYKKEKYRFVGEALAARGFLVVIPDYRLYPDVYYPAFIDDCAQALVWTHENAATYGGDIGKFALMGHSAGAYNAAMLMLDPVYLQRAGGDRDWVKAMVGLAGPYDFLPLEDDQLEALFSTAKPLKVSQPIEHVDGRNPPMLLLAGETDDTVYVKNTYNLYAKIQAAGGPVEKHTYPDMGHAKIVAVLATRLQGRADVMKRVIDFIDDKLDIPNVPTR